MTFLIFKNSNKVINNFLKSKGNTNKADFFVFY
jgi:hypothetical protein